MKRRTHLQRTRPLVRGKGLKRTPFRSAVRGFEAQAAAWRRVVLAKRKGLCWLCPQPAVDPHHIIPARRLRRIAASWRKEPDYDKLLAELLYDPRNGLPLCRDCHEAHENASRRIPRDVLPASALEFARAIDREYVLDQLYADAA